MRSGSASATAQRVAAYRLGFDRLPAPDGDPSADEALARDVAGHLALRPHAAMSRYLRARTAFFDRVVVNALERDVAQVVAIGAGYDGRSLRYARPGVRWWEVDHPDTQADKRSRIRRLGLADDAVTYVSCDLEAGGVATALSEGGFGADAPSLFLCEGVVVYLRPDASETLLSELRTLATPGTRMALSLSVEETSRAVSRRRSRLHTAIAALGEPAMGSVTLTDATDALDRSRWRPVETSERARRAGLVVLAPVWAPPPRSSPESAGAVARFMERQLYRCGADTLAEHLQSTYGMPVTGTRELDLGVFRVDRADGSSWMARILPASRPVEATRVDADLLAWLAEIGFPAERPAGPEPVSLHDGQSVLVTQRVPGAAPPPEPGILERSGRLLGRLHALPAGCPAANRPGGSWHHLILDAPPSQERCALAELLDAARARVPEGQVALYDELRREVEALDGFEDLPHSLVHPDPVPRNVIVGREGNATVIDWAGAGLGPRVVSLGCLLWAASSCGSEGVRAALRGYQEVVALDPAEWQRLDAAAKVRPLTLACWTFATGRKRLPGAAAWWRSERRRTTRAIAAAGAG